MKNVYLINEIIIFDPENYSLTPRALAPSGKITLHGPASECLRILLSQPGQPVSQKALFEQVWQRKGVVVSTNTLYQSIASIRKGLKAAGLEEEIIRTLPKQGFQCNATVQSGELSEFLPRPVVNKNSVAVPLEVPLTEQKSAPARVKPGYGLFLSVGLSIAIMVAFVSWSNNADDSHTPEYYPAGKIEQCTLVSSWSGEEYSQSQFLELKQRYPFDCGKKRVAYLTLNRMQSKSSLMLCSEKIENADTQCRTIIFKDADENK